MSPSSPCPPQPQLIVTHRQWLDTAQRQSLRCLSQTPCATLTVPTHRQPARRTLSVQQAKRSRCFSVLRSANQKIHAVKHILCAQYGRVGNGTRRPLDPVPAIAPLAPTAAECTRSEHNLLRPSGKHPRNNTKSPNKPSRSVVIVFDRLRERAKQVIRADRLRHRAGRGAHRAEPEPALSAH